MAPKKESKTSSSSSHKEKSSHHKKTQSKRKIDDDLASPKNRDRISKSLKDSNLTATTTGSDHSRDSMSDSKRFSATNAANPKDVATTLEDPVARFQAEWRDPAWFGLADSGQVLDVRAGFGTPLLLLRWPIFLVVLLTFVYEFFVYKPISHYLGQFSTWGCLLTLVACGFSLYNGHARPRQPLPLNVAANDEDALLDTYMKVFWLVFNVALHVEFMASLIFWCFDFPQDPTRPIQYGTIMMHGGVLLLLCVDGLMLNRIPTRVRHFWVCLAVDCFYVLVVCIFELAHINGGDHNSNNVFDTAADKEVTPNLRGNVAAVEADMRPSQEDPVGRYLQEDQWQNVEDVLYPALDFENYTGQAVALLILIPFIFAPLLFALQYLLSLFSCCSVNGYNRRYLEEQPGNIVVKSGRIVRPTTPTVQPAGRSGNRRPSSRKEPKRSSGPAASDRDIMDVGNASFNASRNSGSSRPARPESRTANRPPSRAANRPPSRAANPLDNSFSELP